MKLLLSPAQACSDLTTYNSSNHRPVFPQWVCKEKRHNYSAEESKTYSLMACSRSPNWVAEKSKSSSYTMEAKSILPSSFPLPLLHLVLLRNSLFQQIKGKNIFPKASESVLWLCGPNRGICVFMSKNSIFMLSGFCRHPAPFETS